MNQQLFIIILFAFSLFFIHNSYMTSEIRIQTYRNNTYVIKNGQIAVFESDTKTNYVECILKPLHNHLNIIVNITHKNDNHMVYSIPYDCPLTQNFTSGDIIHNIGQNTDYLMIDCETK